MGFFSNLLKGEARKLISNAVDKAVDGFTQNKEINKVIPVNPDLQAKGEKGLRARFEQIVATDFAAYELRKDIPASEPDAVGYTYGLYKGGMPCAFINVISDRNLYKKPPYVKAKQASVSRGVPHMNFFSHMPNEMGYISNRLKENGLS